MKAHGVNRILTFNAGDFTRYDGIQSILRRLLDFSRDSVRWR